MRKLITIACVFGLLLGTMPSAGCGVRDASALVPAQTPKAGSAHGESAQLVAAVNAFGIDLLDTISVETTATNVAVSPLSVHAVLSMAALGAEGETKAQMRDVLRTETLEADALGEQWASLLRGLGRRSGRQTLDVANALWGTEGLTFKEPFLAADKDYFGARVGTADLQSPDAVDEINGWVDDNTHGMIPQALSSLPDQTAACLVNAVYFEGKWQEPFKEDRTYPVPFMLADGDEVTVQMMGQSKAEFPYFENDLLQATRLAYRGGDAAYYVFLPKEGSGPDDVLGFLGEGGLADVREALLADEPEEMFVGIPRLDSQYSADLVETLATMGMPLAFDPVRAEFGPMAESTQRLYLGMLAHGTRLIVDEEGTSAASVTIGGGGGSRSRDRLDLLRPSVRLRDRRRAERRAAVPGRRERSDCGELAPTPASSPSA